MENLGREVREISRKEKRIKRKNKVIIRLIALLVLLIIVGVGIYFGIMKTGEYLYYRNSVDIKLLGDSEAIIDYGSEYTEQNATAMYRKKDVSNDIKIENNLDLKKIGTYNIKYTYTAPGSKHTGMAIRKITIRDKVAPELVLKGSKDINVKVGGTYTEPGYTAIDNYDGDITSKVTIEGSVDVSKVGEYTLVYNAKDSSENLIQDTRTVKVSEKAVAQTNTTAASTVTIKRVAQTDTVDPNSTVFVGDSTTLHLGYHAAVAYGQVWNKPSMDPNTVNLWTANIGQTDSGKTAKELAAEYKPVKMVVTLGSNGASWMKVDYFISCYTQFINSIKEVSPATTVVVQSIFPVTADYDAQGKGLNNTNIEKMNTALKQMASNMGLKYLDTASALKGSDGKLVPGYNNGDGVHLNASGCQIVVNYVKSH